MLISNNTQSKSNPSPWMFTKQVNSKSVSSSRFSEISEESGRHLTGGQQQKKNTRNSIIPQRLPIQESTHKTKTLMQQGIPQFNTNTESKENQNSPIKQSNFLKALKTERIKLQFIRNLFTNSYILPSNKKKLIYDQYQEAEKEIMLGIKFKFIKKNIQNQQFLFFLLELNCFPNYTNFIVILWDRIGMFFNFIILWLTPFLLSFQNNSSDIQVSELLQIITIFLISDIVITLNKGVIIQGIAIKKRRKIIQQYIKSNNALNDILNLVLWTFIQYKFIHKQILGELLTIFQLLATYTKIQKYFSNNFQYVFFKGGLSYIMDFVSLLLSIYFFTHIVACFWHYVGQHSIEQSWLKMYELDNSSCWIRYNYSFYWATMNMTTVGYGDIIAQSQIEIIFANIVMFLSSGVFAYFMNSIGLIIKHAYDAQQKYKRSLLQMNNFMCKNQVEQQIQSRIRNYIKYYIESEQNENLEDVNRLISVFPSHLQKDLKGNVQLKVINNLKVLKNHFSKQTQLLLSKNLELVKFSPGNVIYKNGDIQDKNLYFIVEGEVVIYDDSSKMKFSKLKQMEAFGVYQFFTNFPPKTSAKSVGFSNIYKISRTQFLEVLKFNNQDFERFHQIKDQIIFNSNLRILDMQYQFCNRYSHQEIDCPLLVYQPDLEQRLKKNAFIQKICPRLYKERKTFKFQTKINYILIVERTKEFLQDQLESEINNSLQLAINEHRFNSHSDDYKKSANAYNEEEIKDGEAIHKPNIKPVQQYHQQDHKVVNSYHASREQTYNIKEFQMLDEIRIKSEQNLSLQIDHQQQYEYNFPSGNFNIAVNELERQNQKILKFLDKLSKYTKLRGVKLRQIFAKMHRNI